MKGDTKSPFPHPQTKFCWNTATAVHVHVVAAVFLTQQQGRVVAHEVWPLTGQVCRGLAGTLEPVPAGCYGAASLSTPTTEHPPPGTLGTSPDPPTDDWRLAAWGPPAPVTACTRVQGVTVSPAPVLWLLLQQTLPLASGS